MINMIMDDPAMVRNYDSTKKFVSSSDLNECQIGSHSCEQVCNNTLGSHYCLCFDGYRLNDDNYSCTG